jgi:S-formylglutathione hydrolase FrmB
VVEQTNEVLNRKLNSLGVAHLFGDYGGGTHSWPYWNRDLKEDLPNIMKALERATAAS